MANDISPKLLADIKQAFTNAIKSDKSLSKLFKKGQNGKATYVDANRLAIKLGKHLSNAYKSCLNADTLPNGRMYWNICKAVIEPTMTDCFNITIDFSEQVQKALNNKGKIGMNPIKPTVDQSKIDGIMNRLASDDYDNIKWILEDSAYMQNFLETSVDEMIRTNAEMQYNSGLNPIIVRTYHEGDKYCPYCAELAGTYTYPVDREIYKRHRDCHCTVEYQVGKVRQDAHTKNYYYGQSNVSESESYEKLLALNTSTLTPKEAIQRQKALEQFARRTQPTRRKR